MGKGGAIRDLIKSSLEQILESEMTEHLGYDKHSPEGNNSGKVAVMVKHRKHLRQMKVK